MNNTIKFNGFKVNLSTRKLYKNNKEVSIQNKPYELLLYLSEHKDRAISKDELINKVWNGSIVSDSTLSHAIFKLRASLRDNKGKENIIRTARGFGFQFIAELDENGEGYQPESINSSKKNTYRRLPLIIYLVPLLGLLIFIYIIPKSSNPQSNKIASPKKSTQLIGFYPKTNSTNKDEWLFISLNEYLNQLLVYSENTNPELLIKENSHFKPNSDNTIFTSITDNMLSLEYDKVTKLSDLTNIPNTISEVNRWACNSIFKTSSDCNTKINKLTASNPYVTENYLRALYSNKIYEYEKSINYLNICLQEDSQFILARYELAKNYFSLSQYTKSIAQLSTITSSSNNHRLLQRSHILLGKNYYRISEYEKSKHHFLKVIEKNKINNSLKAIALVELAQVYKEKYDIEIAYNYAKQGNTILKDLDLPNFLARSYKVMGSIKNGQGNLDEANKLLNQALNIYEDTNELSGLSAVLSQLGSVAQRQGDLSTSLTYANRRLFIITELGDPIEIAGTHLQLANLYLELGDMQKATEHANNMWEIAVKEKEPRAKMLASLTLGEIASAKNHSKLALTHYNQALNLSQQLGLNRREILMLCNMGKVAIDGNLYKQANDYLIDCKKKADNLKMQLFQIVARLYLGELARNKELTKVSENYLNDALELTQNLANDEIKKGIRLEFFYLYINNNLKQAEYHLQLVPDNFKNSFLYLIAKSELEYNKQNHESSFNFIQLAKQEAGDHWSKEDEKLLININQALKKKKPE